MQNNLIETIEYKGKKIEIFYDQDATSPDEWGNNDNFLVYDHRQFNVERAGYRPREIFDHMNETKKMFFDGYHVFVLYAYIHSGVSLSLGRGGYPFNDRWDVSSTGYVLVKREKGTWRRAQALKQAQFIVDDWNTYLGGEVYGYNSDSGSCWGFYGPEGLKQMIEEAKNEIDYDLKQVQKSHFEQLKKWILNRVPLLNRQPLQLTY